ncbi:hypothetical protein [Pseudomonas putida]|uniref:Uncharacterized protein n=1 Tax=Pseudomonas putida TaxID=303 RepID=A0ABD7BGR0_PSEPU|nr:hypothetical protein [Pseudomonas putida]QOC98846.1 hypothetical protein ID616_03835 [Pseudomonas putida]
MNLVQYLWERSPQASHNLPGYQCAQGRIGIAITAFCGLPSITYEADWKFISRRDEVKAAVREDQAEELA